MKKYLLFLNACLASPMLFAADIDQTAFEFGPNEAAQCLMQMIRENNTADKINNFLDAVPNIDKNYQDPETGDTCVHTAVRYLNKYALQRMLSLKFPLSVANYADQTPIQLALFKSCVDDEIKSGLWDRCTVMMIIEASQRTPNPLLCYTQNGKSALYDVIACHNVFLPFVWLLCKAGAARTFNRSYGLSNSVSAVQKSALELLSDINYDAMHEYIEHPDVDGSDYLQEKIRLGGKKPDAYIEKILRDNNWMLGLLTKVIRRDIPQNDLTSRTIAQEYARALFDYTREKLDDFGSAFCFEAQRMSFERDQLLRNSLEILSPEIIQNLPERYQLDDHLINCASYLVAKGKLSQDILDALKIKNEEHNRVILSKKRKLEEVQ